MKDTLRTRLEFLWAKLAGRDVDIDTLTPDAPTNMVEKLMLETAGRIADAEESGGSSSGSGNMILDLDNLPKPMLDGVEIEEIVFNAGDRVNTESPTTYFFMCDCPDGNPPPIIKRDTGDGMFEYTPVVSFQILPMYEAILSEDADEYTCLLNDINAIACEVNEESPIFLLPTTAQFGIRKAET